MSSEYDYNPDTESVNRTENRYPAGEAAGQNPAYTDQSGAYRYSGSSIPGQNGGNSGGTQNAYTNYSAYSGQNDAYSGQNSAYNGQTGGYNYQRPGYAGRSTGAAHGTGNADGTRNANPMSGYNVTPPEKKKKSSGAKGIIAAAIICALIGGIGGGAAVGMALRGSSAGSAEPAAVEAQAADTEVQSAAAEAGAPESTTLEIGGDNAGNINTTVIDVTTNSQTTNMTPQNVYEQYVNAVVAISNEGTTTNMFGQVSPTASSGSGFIISEDGYIVTNNHVVAGAEKLTVMMTSGEEYEATIIGADAENDVALIKIDASGLPTVSIGSTDTISVGEQVCAIGNPLGELTNTLTVGYVSALDREIYENGTPINMFQTDCAINSGNSGGPIFDMHGNVVGITTAKYSSSGSSYSASIEGIGFCIPIDEAMDIVSDLLEYGYVKGRPSLGIACQAISSTVTQYYHLPVGVYVYSVESGSAAENAGLLEGDIITEVDGTTVETIAAFKGELKKYSAGDTATLTVYRSETGETLELKVTFDEKNATATSYDAAAQQAIPGTIG